jgi:hypothetical protein
MGGLPSYTDLLTCLEMARVVEKDRAQQKSAEQLNQKPSRPIIINLRAGERVLDLQKSIVSRTHTSTHPRVSR